MSLPKFGAFLTLLLSSQFALGATVSQEREELTSLQRELDKQQQQLATIQAEIQTLPAAIEKAQAEFSEVDTEYQSEKKTFNKIKIEHATSPSDNTERQLKLAEIKFGLAERRYQKAKSDLEELQEQEQSLQRQLSSTESSIVNSRSQINRQEQRLADAVETAERQEREAERTRAEQERKAQLAAAKPVIEPPKAEIQVPPPQPTTPEPVVEPASSNNTVELTEDEFEELQFAKEKMSATEELVAEASDNDRPAYSNLNLTGNNFDDIPFEYLGNNQYRTDVSLHRGRHSFRIEDLRFRVDVPEKFDSAQVYVFLVDASDRNRLKASYFRKELLSYFDKEVAVIQPEPTLADKVARSGVIETADGIFMSEEEYEEFQFAKTKMAETEKLVAADTDGTPNFDTLELRNSDIGDQAFQYLGNQQYRLDLALTSGRHVFRIERLRFDVNVPESDAAQDYIFLVDARDKDSLRASYFRKFLLNYADKEVAVAQ